MATLIEKERSDEFRNLPPPPSESAEGAWNIFEKLTGVEHEGMRDEAREIVKITFDFGGTKKLKDRTYEAAYLVPIMNKLTSSDPVERDAAFQALGYYNSEKSKDPEYIKNRKYIRAISRDMVEIDHFLNKQYEEREELASPRPETDNVLERQYKNPILKKYKKNSFDHALELIADKPSDIAPDPKGINIESVLLAAASEYYALRHSDEKLEDTVLRAVYAAETFYEPVLDTISFGALGSMAFKREIKLIKLSRNGGTYKEVRSGKVIELTDEKIAIARDILSQLPPPEEMPHVTASLIGELTEMHAVPHPVLYDTSGHGIQFTAGMLYEIPADHPDEDDDAPLDTPLDFKEFGYRGRVQTDEKLAGKITVKNVINARGVEETKIEQGADLVGVTLIFDSDKELLDMYGQVVVNADALNSRTIPTKSRNKDSPLHVSGEGLIELLKKDSGGLGEIDTRVKKSGYEVAKITLLYTPEGYDYPIPYEVVFQTVKSRFKARIGEASHAFQDEEYETNPLRIMVGEELHVRRTNIGEGVITTLSEQGGEEFFRDFKRSKIRSLGRGGIRNFIQSDDSGVL